MLNTISLAGRLTDDPELKQTPNGVSVTSFTIAVDRDYSGSEEKKTDFIPIVAWRNTAEFICKYWQKGKMIILNGSLQIRNYTTQDGSKRYVAEVIATNVYFAGDKAQSGENTQNFSRQPVSTPQVVEYTDDDLPF